MAMYNGNPKPATPPSMQAGDTVTVKVVSNDVHTLDNRRTALRASLPLQIKAMFIKNLHFQKRRKWANCCLCVLPVFFILILVALQIIINNLLRNSGNFTCPDDPSTATNAQRPWCAIANPVPYPPLLKLSANNRAPNAFLYTGLNSDTLASSATFTDMEIDRQLSLNWMQLKAELWTGINASCNIQPFVTAANFSSIMDDGCATSGEVTGALPEFSATQWSQKGKGILSSRSPQVQALVALLTGFPGGLDAFATCASKGMSAFQNPRLFRFMPMLEPRLPMATFARLGVRIYEDPAFAPLFLQSSSAQSEAGRFGNVACVANNRF
jgi:hypothetical protein